MNLQAEISWIQSELLKVKDPELINAFKSMLKYRNVNKDEILKAKLTSRALKSEKDIEEGRVHSIDEAENKLNEMLP